jgi:sugar-specific transcriptional regulator TrmB
MKNHMDSETLGLLRRIGLNQYESKVYFSLLNAGPISASDVSSLADIPRPRTYDVLDKLEKRGFISTQPGRPTRFKAINLGEAVESLKTKKQDEFQKDLIEMDEIKKRLADRFKGAKPESRIDAEDYVWVIKDQKNLHSRIDNLINSAKDSILIAANDANLGHKLDAFENSLRKANKRGVDIKIVSPLNDPMLAKRAAEIAEIKKREHNHRMMVIDDDVILFLTPDSHEKEIGTWIKSPYVANNFRCLF